MQYNKKRMPHLVIDEVLLLVDTYFQIKSVDTKEEKQFLVEQLSKNMRNLPFFPFEKELPEFRSIAGMNMCLANVGFVDSDNKSKFGHGSKLQKRIFEYYKENPFFLHKIANSIICVSDKITQLDYSFSDSLIGMILPSYHLQLERSNKTIAMVKEEIITSRKYKCEACGIELDEKYINPDELIELHINTPITKYNHGIVITPGELTCLCPTCHKLAHHDDVAFDVEKLFKKIIL